MGSPAQRAQVQAGVRLHRCQPMECRAGQGFERHGVLAPRAGYASNPMAGKAERDTWEKLKTQRSKQSETKPQGKSKEETKGTEEIYR